MTISTELLTAFFIVYCLIYNAVMFLLALWPPGVRRVSERRATEPLPIVTVLIPALNETSVLEQTVRALLRQRYAGQLEILIIDDYSDDGTDRAAQQLCQQYPNVFHLRRQPPHCRRGKGAALNAGLAFLCVHFLQRDLENWVLAIFDADGEPVEPDLIQRAAELFSDTKVAAAQCGVRIRNRARWLPRLQDIEFATFSFLAQQVRDRTSGAVALGGNAQFVRASVLIQLEERWGYAWDPQSLTEDLELSVRIHLLGGQIRFVPRHVAQEGLESWRFLLRQRHRWAWGTLQVFFKHLATGRLLRCRMPLLKKLDLHYYLSFWIVPVLVLGSWALFGLSQLGVVHVSNRFPIGFLVANSLSFWPLLTLGLYRSGASLTHIPLALVLTTLYTYHWLIALVCALISLAVGRRVCWAKTPRLATLTPAVRLSNDTLRPLTQNVVADGVARQAHLMGEEPVAAKAGAP